MPHWKSLQIERFRRLERVCLEDLGAVNLLVGKNNCGKTSVLEAVAVACEPFRPSNWINTAWEREVKSARTPVVEALSWMFPHRSPRQNGFEGSAVISGRLELPEGADLGLTPPEDIRIQAEYREFREVTLKRPDDAVDESAAEEPSEYAAQMSVRLGRREPEASAWKEELITHEFRGDKIVEEGEWPVLLPHQLVLPVSHRTDHLLLRALDKVLEARRKNQLIELLGMFAEDVDDIEIRSPQGRRAVIHLHHRGLGYVPLAVEGDGMRRALAFASAAAMAREGVLLLDEVETALHRDALSGVFRFLVEACREIQVQLFVTTHSLEAVDAMLSSVGESEAELVAYRLPDRGSGVPVKRFAGPTLRDLRHEGGLDIR